MAIMPGGRAPYTTTHCGVAVYEKHRQMGLRTINVEMMPRIGVSESLAGRTVQAMILLGFYNEDGQVTPAFDALRKMSEDEARTHLAALLREAYGEVLKYVDPATATLEEIERQFRVFEPTGQVPRMVQLFIGLFTYVGIRKPTDDATRANASSHRLRRTKANTGSTATRKRAGTETMEPSHTSSPATPPGSNAASDSGEKVVIDLGDAGKVTVNVNVRWFSLPDDTADKLRRSIRELQALSLPATAPSWAGAVNGKQTEERVS
jgi:Family of unknown function (DUF5343)